jgi:hypothetical protein
MGSRRKPRNKGGTRRSYLKTFSAAMINTGHRPDIFRIQESGAFHYTARARSFGVDEHMLEVLNRMFGFEVRTGPPGVTDPRLAVELRMKELREQLSPDRHVVIERGKHFTLKLFFNDTHTLWFFIEERSWPSLYVLKSITYGARERALIARVKGTIRWKERYIPTVGGTNGNQGVQVRKDKTDPTPS